MCGSSSFRLDVANFLSARTLSELPSTTQVAPNRFEPNVLSLGDMFGLSLCLVLETGIPKCWILARHDTVGFRMRNYGTDDEYFTCRCGNKQPKGSVCPICGDTKCTTSLGCHISRQEPSCSDFLQALVKFSGKRKKCTTPSLFPMAYVDLSPVHVHKWFSNVAHIFALHPCDENNDQQLDYNNPINHNLQLSD